MGDNWHTSRTLIAIQDVAKWYLVNELARAIPLMDLVCVGCFKCKCNTFVDIFNPFLGCH